MDRPYAYNAHDQFRWNQNQFQWNQSSFQHDSNDHRERESLVSAESAPTPLEETRAHSANDRQGASTKIQQPVVHLKFLIMVTTLASLTFAFTCWFTQATFSSDRMQSLQVIFRNLSIGNSLGVLRAAQEVTSVLAGYALNKSFETIEWTWVGGSKGMSLLSFLTLSPSTGLLGVFGIAFGRSARIPDRFWAITRLSLVLTVWAAGFVLFFNTDSGVVYNPDFTYQLSGGVGVFNGSLVQPYIDVAKLNKWPPGFGLLARVYDFITNSEYSISISPLSCTGDDCTAFLLPGGLGMTTPWPPRNYPESPVVEIWNAPAVQIEFEEGINPDDQLLQSDCDVIGEQGFNVALEFCMGKSQTFPGSYISRMYICANGTSAEGQCLNSGPTSNISLTMTFFQRQASTINSRSNFSIMAVKELGSPSKVADLDLIALRAAIIWLLDYQSAGIPVWASPAWAFWGGREQLSSTYWQQDEMVAMKSLLALPLWFFQENSGGNPNMNTPSPDAMVTYLPAEFITSASISRPYSKIKIDKTMFMLYIVLEGLPLVLAWLVILVILLWHRPSPRISSYPLVDFASKTSQGGAAGHGHGIQEKLSAISAADDAKIRASLKNARILLRAPAEEGNLQDYKSRRHSSLVLASQDAPLLSKISPGMRLSLG